MRALFAAVAVSLVASSPAAAQEVQRPELRSHRFDEDWRALCIFGRRTMPLDALKCVPLAPDTTLTLGGEVRERAEFVRNPGFGLEQDSDTVLLHRAMLHADLRIADRARLFVQLGAFGFTGRAGEREPFDLDRLDIVQGFVDLSAPLGGGQATLRAGRQEISFGSSRLVGVREGPNVRRAFDGARVFWSGGENRIDAFYVRPVAIESGVFDDRTDHTEAFWGAYATVVVAGPVKADLHYFGLRRDQGRFLAGLANERRHSVGARLFGESGGFDWDWEAVYQFGRFGDQQIRAWTVATDTGYTFSAVPLSPRIGLKADIASGDGSPGDGRLGTFNALYPKLPYFSEANLIAPANIVDVHPSITLDLGSGLGLDLGWNALWRHTTTDAIYGAPFNLVPGIAGQPGRFVGHQAIAGADWRAAPGLTFSGQYVHFWLGESLRRAGGRDVDFLVASASYKW